MQRISRDLVASTVLPPMLLGVLGFIALLGTMTGAVRTEPAWVYGPILLGGAGLALYRCYWRDLADSVHEDGARLLVRKGYQDAHVDYTDIAAINECHTWKGHRIRIVLHASTRGLGPHVEFVPLASGPTSGQTAHRIADGVLQALRARVAQAPQPPTTRAASAPTLPPAPRESESPAHTRPQ